MQPRGPASSCDRRTALRKANPRRCPLGIRIACRMAETAELTPRTSLGEIARLFLRLGTVSFGGPAAHVALMEEEIVRRRRWLTHEQIEELLVREPASAPHDLLLHQRDVRRGSAEGDGAESEKQPRDLAE